MKLLSQSVLSVLLFIITKPSCNDAFLNIQHKSITAVSLSDNIFHKTGADNKIKSSTANTLLLRGGYISPLLKDIKSTLLQSPSSLFNGLFLSLCTVALIAKITSIKFNNQQPSDSKDEKPIGLKILQAKFLIVFWLMRMADWLQGPYFYEVYSSKIINGVPVSLDLISKIFLVGFATTGIFGPWIGRLVDTVGRKAGTLAYALLYSVGALSTRSALLPLLIIGRIAGGLGTSLLFSAPEAWLVGEHQKGKYDGKWLGQTFGWAYAGRLCW